MKSYDKLVRDNIPTILDNLGKNYDIQIVNDATALNYLRCKLNEEVEEFLEDNSLEELADILEVTIALASKLGHSEEELFMLRDAKAKENGGFDKNIILKSVYK